MRKRFLLLILLAATASAQAQPTPVSLQAGPTLQLPSGSRPNDVTIIQSDISFPDLLIPATGTNQLLIYRQYSSHTFYPVQNMVPIVAQQPLSVQALNLVPGSTSVLPTDFVVLTGNGNLTPWRQTGQYVFQAGTALPLRQGLPCAPTDRLVMGNYEGNGRSDLACLSNGPQPSVARVANNGNGALQVLAPAPLRAGDSATVLVTADLNRDPSRFDDLVLPRLNDPAGSVALYPRPTTGPLAPTWWNPLYASTLAMGGPGPARCVAIGSLRTYDLPDLVIGAAAGAAAGVCYVRQHALGTAPFTYQAPLQTYLLPDVPQEMRLEDLNGDRRPELLVLGTNGTLTILTNISATGNDVFDATPITLTVGPDPAILRMADLDADGDLDVIVPCRGNNTVRIFWNTSSVVSATRSAAAAGLRLYPNPATDRLRLDWPGLSPTAGATLLDLTGRTVRTWNAPALTTELPVGDLPRGVYLLRVESAAGPVTSRVELR